MTTNTAAPSWSAILGTWTFTPVADLLIALAAWPGCAARSGGARTERRRR